MKCRDQAYLARVQLAVLDHNMHVEREIATTAEGDQRYHRKYRKQSKKWDVTPVKVKKDYKYIPELISAIFEARKESHGTLRAKKYVQDDHPVNIQATIAHCLSQPTTDIVSNKKSRFSDN